MFKIMYTDESDGNKKKLVWQNSWGLTTRSIGCAIMVHGDDKGAVLAPRVSPVQVVGIPIYKSKTSAEDVAAVKDVLSKTMEKLKQAGLRIKLDDRTDKNPGWKYNYWEQRGWYHVMTWFACNLERVVCRRSASFGSWSKRLEREQVRSCAKK